MRNLKIISYEVPEKNFDVSNIEIAARIPKIMIEKISKKVSKEYLEITAVPKEFPQKLSKGECVEGTRLDDRYYTPFGIRNI